MAADAEELPRRGVEATAEALVPASEPEPEPELEPVAPRQGEDAATEEEEAKLEQRLALDKANEDFKRQMIAAQQQQLATQQQQLATQQQQLAAQQQVVKGQADLDGKISAGTKALLDAQKAPKRLDAQAAAVERQQSASGGTAWNAAGTTWVDKDLSSWATESLKSSLGKLKASARPLTLTVREGAAERRLDA